MAFANTFNIAADITAMGASAQLVVPLPAAVLTVGMTALMLTLEVAIPYHRYSRVLRWLALSLLNRRQLRAGDFETRDGGAVLLSDQGRRTVLTAWQERKKEERKHPFLDEAAPLGLLPHLQAQLLARHLRGDLDAYPPWFWK